MGSRHKNTGSMAETSVVPIHQLALGVRYEPQYRIMDYIGGITDKILYEKDSPFGPNTFPLCRRGSGEYTLLNTETESSLRLTHTDTILQLQLNHRHLGKILPVAANFEEYIYKVVRRQAQLNGVIRFGMLLTHDDCSSSLTLSPVRRYVADDFNRVNSLHMRFTRKLPIDEALVKSGVDDYRNVIYTLEETEEGKVILSIDYQEYFKPPLYGGDIGSKSFAAFAARGLSYYQGEYSKWLQPFFSPREAAQ